MMGAYAYIAAVIALSIAGWEQSGTPEHGRDADYWHGNQFVDVNIWHDEEEQGHWRIACYPVINNSTDCSHYLYAYDFTPNCPHESAKDVAVSEVIERGRCAQLKGSCAVCFALVEGYGSWDGDSYVHEGKWEAA